MRARGPQKRIARIELLDVSEKEGLPDSLEAPPGIDRPQVNSVRSHPQSAKLRGRPQRFDADASECDRQTLVFVIAQVIGVKRHQRDRSPGQRPPLRSSKPRQKPIGISHVVGRFELRQNVEDRPVRSGEVAQTAQPGPDVFFVYAEHSVRASKQVRRHQEGQLAGTDRFRARAVDVKKKPVRSPSRDSLDDLAGQEAPVPFGAKKIRQERTERPRPLCNAGAQHFEFALIQDPGDCADRIIIVHSLETFDLRHRQIIPRQALDRPFDPFVGRTNAPGRVEHFIVPEILRLNVCRSQDGDEKNGAGRRCACRNGHAAADCKSEARIRFFREIRSTFLIYLGYQT